MKTLLKTYLFIKSIIIVFVVSYGIIKTTLTNYTIQSIKNATFVISINSGAGSASAISFNNKKYIITNAHVCLGKSYKEYVLKQNLSKINNKYFTYNLNGDNNFIGGYTVKGSEIRFSINHDICLLPYKPILKSISFYSAKRRKWEKFFFNDDKTLYHATRNQLHHAKIFQGKKLDNQKIARIRNEGFTLLKKDQIKVSHKIIQGDSGSIIYNSQFEPNHVVFANRVLFKKLKTYARNKSKIERKEYQKFVVHGLASTKKQLINMLD